MKIPNFDLFKIWGFYFHSFNPIFYVQFIGLIFGTVLQITGFKNTMIGFPFTNQLQKVFQMRP